MVNMHFRALKTFDLVVLFILKQTNWTLSHLFSVHFVLFQVRMISIFACCLRTSTSANYTPEYPPERSLAIFYLFSLPLLSFSFSPTLFFNCSQLCSQYFGILCLLSLQSRHTVLLCLYSFSQFPISGLLLVCLPKGILDFHLFLDLSSPLPPPIPSP